MLTQVYGIKVNLLEIFSLFWNYHTQFRNDIIDVITDKSNGWFEAGFSVNYIEDLINTKTLTSKQLIDLQALNEISLCYDYNLNGLNLIIMDKHDEMLFIFGHIVSSSNDPYTILTDNHLCQIKTEIQMKLKIYGFKESPHFYVCYTD